MAMNSIKQAAVRLAHDADKVETIKSNIHEAVMIGEKAKQTVHKTYLAMLHGIGKDKLDTVPRPGSEKPAVILPGDNSVLWDKYDDVDDNGTKRDGSYVNDFADASDEGVRINTAIRNISGDTAIADPDKQERIGKFSAQKTNLRSLVRRTFLVHYRIGDIKESFPHVGVSFKLAGDGKTYDLDTIKPVCLTDKAPNDNPDAPRAYKYLSIGEFLALKLELAKVNAATMGQWKALLKASKKGKKKGKGGTEAGAATQAPRIVTMDQAEGIMAEFSAWLGKSAEGATDKSTGFAKIMHKLANMPAGDERKHFVMTLGNIIYGLDGINVQINDEYQRYMTEQNAMNAGLKAA